MCDKIKNNNKYFYKDLVIYDQLKVIKLPMTVVSSGISSMKHFLSPSAIWKYNAETTSSNNTRAIKDDNLINMLFLCLEYEHRQISRKMTWHTSSNTTVLLLRSYFGFTVSIFYKRLF